MRRTFLLLAALVVAPAIARAQGGVNFYWNDCGMGVPAAAQYFACTTNTGPAYSAFGTVIVPIEVPHFVGLTGSISLCAMGGMAPAWWALQPGGCRENALSVSFDPASNSSQCFDDVWGGQLPVQAVTAEFTPPAASSFRLRMSAALPAGSETALAADGSEFYMFRLVVRRDASTGDGSCAGCLQPVVLFLDACRLQQADGSFVTISGPAASNWLSWNAGDPTTCYVPSSNRTWGAIKSLYR